MFREPGEPGTRTGRRQPLQKILYFPLRPGIYADMIAVIDTNIWGFLAVPVGVTLCFGPALFVWVRDEYFSKPPDGRSGGR
jgi:hypothetical protein